MKNIKSTILILYILLYIQYISTANYEYTINVESNYIPDELIYHFNTTTSLNKNNLLNSKSNRGIECSFYCKNDICLAVKQNNIKPFIEFPDENGYIHKYILNPYTNDYKKNLYEYNDSNNKTILVSTECKNDTQCLSNKCLYETCTYNENSNIERCDVMYTKATIFSSSEEYIYCGKMIGESCKRNSECSYKSCDKICRSVFIQQPDKYKDDLDIGIIRFCIVIALIIISIFISCCCLFIKCPKCTKNNNINIDK